MPAGVLQQNSMLAKSSLPNHLVIHDTTATQSGQNFSGINLGTIKYANDTSSLNLNELLKALPTATDAPFSAYQRQHSPICLPDTRVDILQTICDWIGGKGSHSIFWLSGLAGTGKTTIAQTVAAKYSAKGQLAGSFFFSRAGGDVSHARKFVTSLAFQLASAISALKRPICEAIAKRTDIADHSLDEQWHELVLDPLLSLNGNDHQLKYVIVVDALDECEDESNVQIILRLLAEVQSLKAIQVRVLLTSRPEVPIRYGFSQMRKDEHQNFVLHDIEPSIVDHDISVLLREKLRNIRRKNQPKDDWPEESVINRLVQKSGGLFIWAATACRFIEQDSQLAETRLFSFLTGEDSMLPPERKLDRIYTTVLTNSIQGEYNGNESQVLYELFRQVVGPIVTLLNPLSISSLAGLLGKNIESLRRTLSRLHSVLDVPEIESNAIRLLHPSFRDFLLSKNRCSNPQFYVNEQLAHQEMFKHCLRAMSNDLRRDICNLQRPGTCIADLTRSRVNAHIQPHLQYACRFWVYHYERSDIGNSGYNDIEVFLRTHFLHWLESMSLLDCISDAASMIHMLDTIFSNEQKKQPQNRSMFRNKIKSTFLDSLSLSNWGVLSNSEESGYPPIQAIIYDAKRFILAFYPVLLMAPLQVYYAGLIFSPSTSIIRKIFSNEFPVWLPCMPNTSEYWSPCFQTLKGNFGSITAVAFSLNGKTLASASRDRTVRLWDASSGKALQILKGHPHSVRALAFSSDSKTLASASEDGTVKLWDTNLGKALQTLRGHSGRAMALTFSLDGNTLASALPNNTVMLWDASSGKTLQVLKGNSAWVMSIAFSPDGKSLAVASSKIIKLWDISSGKALKIRNAHSRAVIAVAFSPDGKTLASASIDQTIKLWDVSLIDGLQIFEERSDWVIDVAFSPDGKTLASASDKTVRLWDASSGKAQQTLKGHSKTVYAVAFSPDSKTLASASNDTTIRLWNASSGKLLQTFKGTAGPHILPFKKGSKVWATKAVHSVFDNDAGTLLPRILPLELISVKDDWVLRGGERILWLPSEYRSEILSIHDNGVAFGYKSGQVTILHFVF